MLSPLQLNSFTLQELIVKRNSSFQGGDGADSIYRFKEIDFNGATHKTKPLYKVALWFEIVPKNRKTPCDFEVIRARAEGVFSFTGSSDDDFMPLNQLAILYGTMRGIVATVTSIGDSSYLLPTVNFVELGQRKAKQLATALKKKKKAASTRKASLEGRKQGKTSA